jgi:hypothetical protein
MANKRVNLGIQGAVDKNKVPLQASIFDFVDDNSTIFTIAEEHKKTLDNQWAKEQTSRQSLFEIHAEKAYLEAIDVLKTAMNEAINIEGLIDYPSRIRAAGLLLGLRTKIHEKSYIRSADQTDQTITHIHKNDGFNFSR